MSIKTLVSVILMTSLLAMTATGQKVTDAQRIKALDQYVNFSNESIHGLLIVHRLLENFNKNINKYVDLPDQQINFYSNKDLPQDIFEDAENWFYETSPNEWYGKILLSDGTLPGDLEGRLKAAAKEMHAVTSSVNKLRFELEEQIKTLDLTKRENLSLVYEKLEKGVTLYRNFYSHQLDLEEEIQKYARTLKFTQDDMQFPVVLKAMNDQYSTTRAALNALYHKEDDNFAELLKAEEKALVAIEDINLADYNSTRLINSRVQMYWGNIKRQATESIKKQKSFLEAENLPEEYKLYDKYYYYYNIDVINKFNRYGNGIVFEMNRTLDYLSLPVVRYFEMPHYFKVIYPKLLDKTEYLAASDPLIKTLPKVVKGRSVVEATRSIMVDKPIVNFQVYDHKIIDKDIVSLSFNGDWIVEKLEISGKPHDFILKLNESGKNFLLLHADDMGRQPPATIALSYTYKGKKELIILNSDTQKSEVIEIKLDAQN